MKKILTLLFVFCTLYTFAQTAPEIEWENNLGGESSENAHSFVYSLDGGCVIAGWTNSNDHDVDGHLGYSDLWVVKLNNTGNIEWNKIYGGSNGGDMGSCIDQTGDGGFVVAGRTNSSNGDVSQPIGNGDGWLLKLDATGNLEWEKTYGSSELPEQLYNVISLPNGKYIVTGSVIINEGTLGEETNYWVASLDVDGNMEWQQSFPGKYIQDIRRTTNGGYIMTGDDAYEKSWAILLDGQGNTLWEQNFPDINADANFFELYTICETTDGGFVAAGSWVHFPTTEAIVLKLNASGNILWETIMGGGAAERFHDIHNTSDGNYILVGESNSIDGDVSGNNGGLDIWVVKLDGMGEIIWDTNLGGSQNEKGNSILETGDEEFIVLGSTMSSDGDISDFYGINTNDIWAVKLNANLGISTFAESEKIKVHPNPVKTTFVIETPGNENVEFIFRDINGRQIHIPRTNRNEFNATSLPSGIYFATVKSAVFRETFRIIKL